MAGPREGFALMPTRTAITAAEAARLTGVHKSTITRAVKDGKFSARKDAHGRLLIEPIDLFMVFPPMPEAAAAPEQARAKAMIRTDADTDRKTSARLEPSSDAPRRRKPESRFATLRQELEDVRLDRDREKEARLHERRGMEETISDLRRRLDLSLEECRMKEEQIRQLLAQQRKKALAAIKKLEERWSWRRLWKWVRRTVHQWIEAIRALIQGGLGRDKHATAA